MPGPFNHSPARIIQRLLIEEGLLGDPQQGQLAADWPCFYGTEPTRPDNCVTVYRTSGVDHGRTFDGERQEHHGVQIRLRAKDQDTGVAKAEFLRNAVDKDIYQVTVAVENDRYLVHSLNRVGDVMELGKEQSSSRYLYTINYLTSIRKLMS